MVLVKKMGNGFCSVPLNGAGLAPSSVRIMPLLLQPFGGGHGPFPGVDGFVTFPELGQVLVEAICVGLSMTELSLHPESGIEEFVGDAILC